MKTLLICFLSLATLSMSYSQKAFIHYSSASNNTLNWSVIDNALINGQPGAAIQLTKNWNANGSDYAVYNPNETGLRYLNTNKWAVYNENADVMLDNIPYNVFIPAAGDNSYVHYMDVSPIITPKAALPFLFLDNPLLNDTPEAMVFVTHNRNGNDIYQLSPTGVFYTGGFWTVANLDGVNMPINNAFNVYIANEHDNAFYHITTADNISGNTTIIDHPDLNGNPNAILIVTTNATPGGIPAGSSGSATIGVWYSPGVEKWSIFNEDATPMDAGRGYNVLIVDDDNNSPLPSPWQTTDVGTVNVTGAVDYDNESLLLSGSGTDIWGTKDAFRFVYQELTENENIDLKAKVASISNTNEWAKAGLMIRESLDSNSTFAISLATTENGTHFQKRSVTGDSAESSSGPAMNTPVWLRVLKKDNKITGFVSDDGNTWEKTDSLDLEFSGSFFAGVAITSHNDTVLTTALIQNLTLTLVEDEIVDLSVGNEILSNNYKVSGIMIFPNPTNSMAYIQFSAPDDKNINLSVYSIDGKLVREMGIAEYSNSLYSVPVDMRDFDPGIYLVVLRTSSTTRTEKLIYSKQ